MAVGPPPERDRAPAGDRPSRPITPTAGARPSSVARDDALETTLPPDAHAATMGAPSDRLGRAPSSDPFAATVGARADSLGSGAFDETMGAPNPRSDAFAETIAGDSDVLTGRKPGSQSSAGSGGSFGGGVRSAHYRPGEVIADRYQVTRILGQGGFAVVYAARDRVVDRMVAVKVLNLVVDAMEDGSGKRAAERFEREARAAAMITHPNVVTIYDLGIGDRFAQPFIVMELLTGHDLAHELRSGGAMPPERAIRLFTEALGGLGAGHDRGIVHKDLKPSNLFLTSPGSPEEKLRLFDFGIARLGEGSSGLTKTGEMFGTPQYMAPEYVNKGEVSLALDVYQMGLILVEMLTGKKVVDTEVPITAAMTNGSGSLKIAAELLRGDLGRIVRKALAFEPADRFADANLFAAALAELDAATLPAALGGELIVLSEAPPLGDGDDEDDAEALVSASVTAGMSAADAPSAADFDLDRSSSTTKWIGAALLVALLVAVVAWGLGGSDAPPPTAAEPPPSSPPAAATPPPSAPAPAAAAAVEAPPANAQPGAAGAVEEPPAAAGAVDEPPAAAGAVEEPPAAAGESGAGEPGVEGPEQPTPDTPADTPADALPTSAAPEAGSEPTAADTPGQPKRRAPVVKITRKPKPKPIQVRRPPTKPVPKLKSKIKDRVGEPDPNTGLEILD